MCSLLPGADIRNAQHCNCTSNISFIIMAFLSVSLSTSYQTSENLGKRYQRSCPQRDDAVVTCKGMRCSENG